MIIIYALVATFIAWIWVDYYRLIDIYQSNHLKYFIFTFLVGCASTLIVFEINFLFLDKMGFQLNGEIINDLLYSVLKIGVVEEFAKITPFIIIYYLFKDEFKEPIDYIAFICTGGLGFAAVENTLYFLEYGPNIIDGRAILSTVGHMFDSALFAYGVVLYKFKQDKPNPLTLLLFFAFASISHGFYDFWLIYEPIKAIGVFVTILYFFITISFFAVSVNNAINNSPHFSYDKVLNPDKISKRILTYYGIVFLIQFILMISVENVAYAIFNLVVAFFTTGFIIIITTLRLSRFKLIKNRWQELKFEMPFAIYSASATDPTLMFPLRIKGDSFNESYINTFYKEFFYLSPLSKRLNFLRKKRLAYIEKKLFLNGDQTYYLTKVFVDNEHGEFQQILLKAKSSRTTMVQNIYPIVAILKIDDVHDLEYPDLTMKDFKFLEWGVIKPHQKEE